MLKKFKIFTVKYFLLLIIVVLAFGLRIYRIYDSPPSLNWDEVSHGYNAFSVLKSAEDEWGVKFPIIFKAYGDYKLPVFIYLAAVSELLFGLNAFALRLPSVMAGVGVVIFTYLLVKELFKNNPTARKFTTNTPKLVALVSSLLVAIEPWSLFLSRGAFEANIALFFIVAGIYFFLKSFSSTAKYLLLSTFLFGISVWTYNSARIFVPLLIFILFVIYNKEIISIFKRNKKISSCYLLFAVFFFLPMFWQLINPVGQARYGKVSIIDEGAVGQIIQLRKNSKLPGVLTRVIYNRPTYFLNSFYRNWVSHFNYRFLFLEGGTNFQFSIPGKGILYLVNLPFFFLGLIILLRRVFKGDRTSELLLSWLILAPIPDSLTREAPQVLRSIVILPIPMIITSIGIVKIFEWLKNSKLLLGIYLLILSLSVFKYLNIYFNEYRTGYSWSWQYGYKEAVTYIKENYNKYDKIIVTKKYGEPHEFVLFFWPWSPIKFRNDTNLIRFYQSNWNWVDRFDKFYFVNDWNIPREEWQDFKLESGGYVQCQNENTRCLLITSETNAPKKWTKLETIKFLDGNIAFELYDNR